MVSEHIRRHMSWRARHPTLGVLISTGVYSKTSRTLCMSDALSVAALEAETEPRKTEFHKDPPQRGCCKMLEVLRLLQAKA